MHSTYQKLKKMQDPSHQYTIVEKAILSTIGAIIAIAIISGIIEYLTKIV